MTFQEALEYLNLPPNSSEQLVQKRYFELTKDYQKAINNAPSDHFSALYQENLDKIEEAYSFLTEQATNKSNSEINQRIQQVQEIVDTFQEEEKTENLNPDARERIQHYINQISSFQASLRQEESKVKSPTKDQELQQIPAESNHGWRWEIKALKNRLNPSTSDGAFIEKWLIRIILNSSFATTSGARKQYYDQLIMVVIMVILILGIIGSIYILFPLL